MNGEHSTRLIPVPHETPTDRGDLSSSITLFRSQRAPLPARRSRKVDKTHSPSRDHVGQMREETAEQSESAGCTARVDQEREIYSSSRDAVPLV